jgi:hypothetical protein
VCRIHEQHGAPSLFGLFQAGLQLGVVEGLLRLPLLGVVQRLAGYQSAPSEF